MAEEQRLKPSKREAHLLLRSVRVWMDDFWDRNRFRIYISGLVVLLLIGVLWSRIFVTIPAGHRGIMFRRFLGGSVLDRTWPEGFHTIPPWDHLTIYETRVMEREIRFSALTKDGLEIFMTISVRFQPFVNELGKLHEQLGPNYFDRVVQPEVQAEFRKLVGDRGAYDLYSNEGNTLQEATKDAQKELEKKFIRLDELLIKRIELPEIVQQAIAEKHRQEQMMLEYSFRLQREEKEAARKRIEAAGIRDFQKIIADGISQDVLRWRGIEATLELARSPNAKMIVIGNDGKLPIILDAADTNRALGEAAAHHRVAGPVVKRPEAGEAAAEPTASEAPR